MELKSADISVVATNAATTTRFLHQVRLHLSTMTDNGFNATALTAIVAPPLEHERRDPMSRAAHGRA
jgi:hypothetical protein